MLKSDIKNLTRKSFAFSFGDFINEIINVFLLPIYIKILTPADLGILSLITIFGTFSRMLMRLGLSDAYLRFYFDYKDNEVKRREIMGATFTALLFVNIVIIIPAYFLIPQITGIFLMPKPEEIYKIALYAPAFLVTLYASFFRSFLNIPFTLLRAQEKAKSFAALSISRFLTNMLLKVLFVAFFKWGVHGIIVVDLVTAVTFTIILTPLIRRNCRFRLDLKILRSMLCFGLPKVPHNLAHHTLNQADRWLLKFYTTETSVGIYSFGYRMASVVKFFSNAFNMAWAPYIFRIHKDKDAPRKIGRISTYFILTLCFVALFITLFAEEALILFDELFIIKKDWFASLPLVPILAFAYVFQAGYFLTNIGLSIAKKTQYYPLITGSSVVFNILVNLFLIRHFEEKGAAITAALSYAVLSGLALLFANKFYKIRWEWGRLFRIFFVTVIIMIANLFLQIDNMTLRILIKYLLICLFPVLLWAAGFFTAVERKLLLDKLLAFGHNLIARFTRK